MRVFFPLDARNKKGLMEVVYITPPPKSVARWTAPPPHSSSDGADSSPHRAWCLVLRSWKGTVLWYNCSPNCTCAERETRCAKIGIRCPGTYLKKKPPEAAFGALCCSWPSLQTSIMLYATSASSPFGGGHRDSHAEQISVQASKIEVSVG